jgi:membrane protease YdiL (CAAX protease family)
MPWDFWLIFIVLAVLLPWRGHTRMKKMLAAPVTSSRTRLLLYGSTIAFQWTMVVIIVWRSEARGFWPGDLGLAIHGSLRTVTAAIVGAAALSAFQWFNLRRLGRTPGKTRDFMQKLAQRLFPQSRAELVVYLVLAATAGLCEEFIYRGFAMAVLRRAGFSVWLVIIISSLLFGLAHLYQGRGGFVGTSVIGVVFGMARIAYDGLVPVMVWHFAIDAVAGAAGPKYLLRSAESTSDAEPSGCVER